MKKTIQERFLDWHKANPRVYTTLVELARQAKTSGHNQYGIKGLWEVLRWRVLIETVGDSFKLNNNYTSRYARLIMDNEEDLQDFFAIRELLAV